MSANNTATLPSPDPISLAHQHKVQAHIAKQITNSGPIAFSEYMQQALYAPGLGYYSAGRQKFGPAGDFVTAPEISPLFGHCLARQCAQVLEKITDGCILEFGAGSGKLAEDILQYLAQINCLPKHYYILEVSADLRERQQQHLKAALPNYFDNIIWLNQLPEQDFKGVILANEVLDAMPVELFHINKDQAVEQAFINYQEGEFQPHWQTANNDLKTAVEKLDSAFATGYTSEVNLHIEPWIKSLAETLKQGAIFLIDYGFPAHEYYMPDRHMGTLMCHFHHHNHDNPYILTGIQDITAHVDFTAVADAADNNHLQIAGFTTQAAFLINCGITELLTSHTDIAARYNTNQQLMMLTSPSEMGELFKVIALTKDFDADLVGFSQFDQRNRL